LAFSQNSKYDENDEMGLQRRHRSLIVVFFFICATLLIDDNFQKSYELVVGGKELVIPATAEEISPSHTEQRSGNEYELQLTTYAHNHTIRTLVVSPQQGIVVGIGTTAFIPCPVPKYTNGSFELLTEKVTYETHYVQDEELQGGPLIIAYFRVEMSIWEEWTQRAPELLVVVDRVLNTTYSLPLHVDPALQRKQPHYLSATTTFRKQYRQYNGLGKFVSNGSKADSWSDQEVEYRLTNWLDFHRKGGVTHFYLIDNESDLSKPNLSVVGDDITYIRAAHMVYDSWRCYSDVHTPPKKHFTVVGQLMLENSILRLAHTRWLMVGDLDEFFVAGNQFDRKLPELIRHYEQQSCLGENPIACTPLNETTYDEVFLLNFLPQIMSATNERLFEVVYRFKPIVRPSLASTISVHYSLPRDASRSTKATIPPRHGWLAHYNKRGGVGSHNWTVLLSNLHNLSGSLREK
jgi:hypothetical protein